jgi:uncharacterized membrane protein YfcA
MSWIWWLILPLIGALGGFLAGMLGVGGGVIFIPILNHLFSDWNLTSAELVRFTLANSIFLVAMSGLAGSYRQFRIGNFFPGAVLVTGLTGMASSWGISWLINHSSWYHREEYLLVFLGLMVLSILNMLFGKKEESEGRVLVTPIASWQNAGVGLIAGSVVALSGLGGGVVMVPLFRMLLRYDLKKATSVSLGCIPLLARPALIQYMASEAPCLKEMPQFNYLVWPYALPMTAGVLIFSSVGVKAARTLSTATLRSIFAALNTLIIIKTLWEIFS